MQHFLNMRPGHRISENCQGYLELEFKTSVTVSRYSSYVVAARFMTFRATNQIVAGACCEWENAGEKALCIQRGVFATEPFNC